MKPKKSLGQNFLKDENILFDIVEEGKINNDDIVIEIGPGTGNLTKEILNRNPKKLIVIEKDKQLSDFIEKKFGRLNYSFNCKFKGSIVTCAGSFVLDHATCCNKKCYSCGCIFYKVIHKVY